MNEPNSTEKATILVVDDTPDHLTLVSNLLKSEYRVKVATDGDTALKIAASAPPPGLILLDISMPGMDGYEVCRRLKSSPATLHIPVIFLTDRLDEADEIKGLALGAIDYITKPVNPNILLARVKNHLVLKNLVEFLLDQNERETAERIAGSLKDISGEIGPEGLQQLAGKLQLSIKANRLHRQDISRAGQPTLISQMVQDVKEAQHRTVMVNQQKLAAVCDRLEALLSNDDAEAVNVMDANAELLDIAYPGHSRKIDNSIRSFDFKAALVALRGATGTPV